MDGPPTFGHSDIVLVVAADDGVSPQTIEILNFYKSIVKDSEGGITMVVAMNKIDKPGIDVSESQTKIENELIEQGIIPEGVAADSEYGSPVQFFPISAKNGDGPQIEIDVPRPFSSHVTLSYNVHYVIGEGWQSCACP